MVARNIEKTQHYLIFGAGLILTQNCQNGHNSIKTIYALSIYLLTYLRVVSDVSEIYVHQTLYAIMKMYSDYCRLFLHTVFLAFKVTLNYRANVCDR